LFAVLNVKTELLRRCSLFIIESSNYWLCTQVCANNSRQLSDQTLSYIKSHPLMDKAVPAFGGQPLLVLPALQ